MAVAATRRKCFLSMCLFFGSARSQFLVRETHIDAACRDVNLDDVAIFYETNFAPSSCFWRYVAD